MERRASDIARAARPSHLRRAWCTDSRSCARSYVRNRPWRVGWERGGLISATRIIWLIAALAQLSVPSTPLSCLATSDTGPTRRPEHRMSASHVPPWSRSLDYGGRTSTHAFQVGSSILQLERRRAHGMCASPTSPPGGIGTTTTAPGGIDTTTTAPTTLRSTSRCTAVLAGPSARSPH